MAITYNAGTNTTTVTGYTEAIPCTFLDIYNADVAGAWGVWNRQGTNQYYGNCNLTIGDASTVTYLKSENEHIKIEDKFRWTNHSHFRSGNIDGNGDTYDGSLIEVAGTGWSTDFGNYDMTGGDAEALFYDTKIITGAGIIFGKSIGSTFVSIDCLIQCQGFALYGVSTVLKNTILNDITMGIGIRNTYTNPIENVTVQKSTYGFYFHASYAGKIKNSMIKNTTHDIRVSAANVDSYLINTECGWIFSWAASSTVKIYRQYELDLKVIDKDNVAINAATVKIWDKDSNLIVDTTTNASGVIATQTTTRGYYNQANGNTLQEASPHLIKIEKAGYTTYEADFTLEDKTDWLIALQVVGGGLMRNPPMTGGMV